MLEAQQSDRDAQWADWEVLKEVAQRILKLKGSSVTSIPVEQKMKRASYYLQKMTAADDVEAYLTTFERIAEGEA